LNLFGNGAVAVDLLASNIKYQGSRIELLANDRQEKLKSTYKSPVGIAGGANWQFRRSSFGVAMQYFGKLKVYDILQAKPSTFIRPESLNATLGSDNFLRVKSAAKAVFNLGIGYEYTLKKNVSLTASLRSDQSYFDDQLDSLVGIRNDVTTWNIYHLTMGSTFTKGRSKVSIGLVLSGGVDKSKEQEGNFSNPSEGNLFQGSTTITRAKYNAIGFILGYAFVFNKFN
jgi:hypothetical protein